jgi:hypothetical protein
MTGFADDFDDIDDTPSLADLWAGIAELTARVDSLAVDTYNAVGPPNPTPVHASLVDWVSHWWVRHAARDTTGNQYSWCEQWWDHAEAVSRLQGLWQRWEQLQGEYGGMAAWWREADQQIPHLMGPTGPFRHCKTGDTPRHKAAAFLPVVPPRNDRILSGEPRDAAHVER